MWHRAQYLYPAAVVFLLFAVVPDLILALSNVSVQIPAAVKRGDNALLACNYDIENDTLYTVKWYKGRREFYRYTPKENPAWKIFPVLSGINVETSQSNASHVLLRQVPLSISGKFACEVSADAPSFHTFLMAGEMEVVELPTQRPIVTGIHSRYRLGDIVNGNCSSDYSKPAANLTWWINDVQVPYNYIRSYDIQKHTEENLESSVLEINFIALLQHFVKGRLRLKCSARIHNIYAQETEKIIEESRPRILASGRSPDMNLYPFDHPNSDGEFYDQNELYLTHYKNPLPSGASPLAHKQLHTWLGTQQVLLISLLCICLFPITVMATNVGTGGRRIVKTIEDAIYHNNNNNSSYHNNNSNHHSNNNYYTTTTSTSEDITRVEVESRSHSVASLR